MSMHTYDMLPEMVLLPPASICSPSAHSEQQSELLFELCHINQTVSVLCLKFLLSSALLTKRKTFCSLSPYLDFPATLVPSVTPPEFLALNLKSWVVLSPYPLSWMPTLTFRLCLDFPLWSRMPSPGSHAPFSDGLSDACSTCGPQDVLWS